MISDLYSRFSPGNTSLHRDDMAIVYFLCDCSNLKLEEGEGAEGPQQGPEGPGGPKGPQPSAGARRRAAVGRPNLLVS